MEQGALAASRNGNTPLFDNQMPFATANHLLPVSTGNEGELLRGGNILLLFPTAHLCYWYFFLSNLHWCTGKVDHCWTEGVCPPCDDTPWRPERSHHLITWTPAHELSRKEHLEEIHQSQEKRANFTERAPEARIEPRSLILQGSGFNSCATVLVLTACHDRRRSLLHTPLVPDLPFSTQDFNPGVLAYLVHRMENLSLILTIPCHSLLVGFVLWIGERILWSQSLPAAVSARMPPASCLPCGRASRSLLCKYKSWKSGFEARQWNILLNHEARSWRTYTSKRKNRKGETGLCKIWMF